MFVMVVCTLLRRMIAKSYVSFPSFGSVRLLWDTSSARRVTAWLEDTERDREQVTHYVETPILVVQHRFLRSHTQRGLADNPRWRVWRSNRQKKNQLRDRVQPLDNRERYEARDEGVARVRCSWRENGGEGSPGSAALSLYARNNILMKERPDSEVPTSGRAAELLASPPLRGRPLPPLHDTGTAECAPCPDYPHHSSHHHTKPRSRAPHAASTAASAPPWQWGKLGVVLRCDGAWPHRPWMLRWRCLVGELAELFSHHDPSLYPYYSAWSWPAKDSAATTAQKPRTTLLRHRERRVGVETRVAAPALQLPGYLSGKLSSPRGRLSSASSLALPLRSLARPDVSSARLDRRSRISDGRRRR